MKFRSIFYVLLTLISLSPIISKAASFGINLYGASYHLNNRPKPNDPLQLNEFNTGLGIRIGFTNDSLNYAVFTEVGTYNDSFNNQAKYLALAFQYRFFKNFYLGLTFAALNSYSINERKTGFAPLPLLTYSTRYWAFNMLYIPSYENYNRFKVIGGYFTIYLMKN